jgi:hypothetical protein
MKTEFSIADGIFASKYQLYLPSKEELKRQLEQVESELGDMIND